MINFIGYIIGSSGPPDGGGGGTKNISSVSSLSGISVPTGTAYGSLSLPSTVLVTYNDASTANLAITWSQGSYNSAVAADYTLTGTLTLEPDTTNNSNLTASIVVTVFAPVSLKINFRTGTASGWVETGTTSPYPGSNTNVDFGTLGAGIGLRSVNGGGSLWNSTGTTGGTTGANTGIYPDAVLTTFWFVVSANIGKLELYNVPAGTYTLDMLPSRGAITGPRHTQFRVNGGSWSTSINADDNTSQVATFTGIQPVSGVITIEVQGTDTPTPDSRNGYINGLRLDRTA